MERRGESSCCLVRETRGVIREVRVTLRSPVLSHVAGACHVRVRSPMSPANPNHMPLFSLSLSTPPKTFSLFTFYLSFRVSRLNLSLSFRIATSLSLRGRALEALSPPLFPLRSLAIPSFRRRISRP